MMPPLLRILWVLMASPPALALDMPAGLALQKYTIGFQNDSKVQFTQRSRMTEDEQRVWVDVVINSGARSYLEWGSGGSTEAAAWRVLHGQKPFHVHTIEGSSVWLKMLKAQSELIRLAEATGRMSLEYADIGSVAMWSMPIGWGKRPPLEMLQQALGYISPKLSSHPGHHEQTHGSQIETESKRARSKVFDVIFIDGRFRAACALAALDLLAPEGTVMVHDFFVGDLIRAGSNYGEMKPFYSITRAAPRTTLALLKPLRRLENFTRMERTMYEDALARSLWNYSRRS